jgi:hypothetical protein
MNKLVEHMEKCANMSSRDEEEDDSELNHHPTNKSDYKTTTQKLIQPVSFFRFVTRLNGQHSLSKMSSDKEIRSKVMAVFLNHSETLDIVTMADDSDNENHDDDNDVESSGLIIQSEEQQHVDTDLNDIRQKVLEYDRQQLKGIQFINAGDGNSKVVQSWAHKKYLNIEMFRFDTVNNKTYWSLFYVLFLIENMSFSFRMKAS